LQSCKFAGLLISQYWYRYQYYRRYFFLAIFGNTRYQYFCQQAAPLRLQQNNARGTTSRVSARANAVRPQCTVQGDVGPKLHAMDTRAGVRLLRGWKNRCQDSHSRLRNVWFETRPRATYSPAGTPRSWSAGDSPPPPRSLNL